MHLFTSLTLHLCASLTSPTAALINASSVDDVSIAKSSKTTENKPRPTSSGPRPHLGEPLFRTGPNLHQLGPGPFSSSASTCSLRTPHLTVRIFFPYPTTKEKEVKFFTEQTEQNNQMRGAFYISYNLANVFLALL